MRANVHTLRRESDATFTPSLPRAHDLFRTLGTLEASAAPARRGLTFLGSLFLHAVWVAALLVVPLLFGEVLPDPAGEVRAFFVAPPSVEAPPPPPPPPPAGARVLGRATVAPPREPAKFVAPVEVPTELPPAEEGLDLGVEGGVPGGVEGGVPGGVLGGVVGGLPPAPLPQATPPPRVVRVGGNLVAPELVYKVPPDYPELARAARLAGVVILEAQVDTQGRVKTVRVLRGHPLLDDAAITAVKQWRYRPLLLNGVPTEFILTATVMFSLR